MCLDSNNWDEVLCSPASLPWAKTEFKVWLQILFLPWGASKKALKLSYHGLIEYWLRYDSQRASSTNFNRNFILQQRGFLGTGTARELFHVIQIPTLTNLLIYHPSIFAFKNFKFFPVVYQKYSTVKKVVLLYSNSNYLYFKTQFSNIVPTFLIEYWYQIKQRTHTKF